MARFNFSVRNGKRWSPCAVITSMRMEKAHDGSRESSRNPGQANDRPPGFAESTLCVFFFFYLSVWKGFGRLVPLGYRRYRPCTCGLSTSSSLTALDGDLILRGASCLDAFSTYPDQTREPGRAPGGTTGVPEVCPTRSSRTSVGSPQISCAHNR